MINDKIVKVINEEIDKGSRFFYFDRKHFKLRSSSPDNERSFYDLDVSDCIEIYFGKHVTKDRVVSMLKFYNSLV